MTSLVFSTIMLLNKKINPFPDSYGNHVTNMLCLKYNLPMFCWEPGYYKNGKTSYTDFWLNHGKEIGVHSITEFQKTPIPPPMIHLRCGDVLLKAYHHPLYKLPFKQDIERVADFILNDTNTVWFLSGGHVVAEEANKAKKICERYKNYFKSILESISESKNVTIKLISSGTSEHDWYLLRKSPKVLSLGMSSFVFSAKVNNLKNLKMFCPKKECVSPWYVLNQGFHHHLNFHHISE